MTDQQFPACESFFECIVANLPARMLVIDEDLKIIYANPTYCATRGLNAEEVQGCSIEEFFPSSLVVDAQFGEAIRKSLADGYHTRWSGYRQPTPDHGERIIDIRLDPCQYADQRLVLLSIEDVTERHRQLYERNMLQQISHAMLGITALPRLLHAILTGITAGGAAGLGFNRAILMLADQQAGMLNAEMAVGPRDAQQAAEIWSRISHKYQTLDDFLTEEDEAVELEEQPLYDLVQQLHFPLDKTNVLPMAAVARGETVHVRNARNDPEVSEELYELLEADEFVVAPMLIERQTIGVVLADNFVTGEPISEADVQLLNTLANQAALAIDRARAYEEIHRRAQELEEAYEKLAAAQKEKIEAEKLATIGEVTAIVAHEIRNPLSTIGGFARSINRSPDEGTRSRRNSQIIIDEVERLEEILQHLLDFTKPPSSELVLNRLEALIDYALQMTENLAKDAGVTVRVSIEEDLPEVFLDHKQCQQVIVNLMRNALEAMPEGGLLTIGACRTDGRVKLYISDTGKGISQEHIDEIFDTFYTTKPSGTGLGLALTQKIVQQHGAEMKVTTKEGEGSTFAIEFPIPSEQDQAK